VSIFGVDEAGCIVNSLSMISDLSSSVKTDLETDLSFLDFFFCSLIYIYLNPNLAQNLPAGPREQIEVENKLQNNKIMMLSLVIII